MEDYAENEIDRYPTDVCPFNEAHRLHSLKLYEHHVLSCKDQHFPSVQKRLCRYNRAHIFVDAGKLLYHEARCEGHPKRLHWMKRFTDVAFGVAPSAPQYNVCPYFPYHFVVLSGCEELDKRSMQLHVESCPRRAKPLAREFLDPRDKQPLVPLAPTQFQSCLSSADLDADLTSRLALERHILYYRDIPLCVRLTYVNKTNQPDKNIFIDSLIPSMSLQFPGLQKHTEARDQALFIVGKLSPDPIDKQSQKAFWGLYGGMENDATRKMAISYQSAAISDRVWLIAHPDEKTGFGGCVSKGELGLFAVPQSDLLGVPSTIEALQRRCDYLADRLESERSAKDLKVEAVTQELNSAKTQSILREDALKQEAARLAEQLACAARDHSAQLQWIKEGVCRDFDEQKRLYDIAQTELLTSHQKAEQSRQKLTAEYEAKLAYVTAQAGEVQRKQTETASKNEGLVAQVGELSQRLEEMEAMWLETQRRLVELQHQSEVQERRVHELQQEKDGKGRNRLLRPKPAQFPPCCLPCWECKEHDRNTIFVPCGHILLCNVCVENKKLPIGRSLKWLQNAEKVCELCHSEVKKVYPAYFG